MDQAKTTIQTGQAVFELTINTDGQSHWVSVGEFFNGITFSEESTRKKAIDSAIKTLSKITNELKKARR